MSACSALTSDEIVIDIKRMFVIKLKRETYVLDMSEFK